MKKDLVCYPTRFGNMVHDRRDKCIGESLRIYGEWAPGEIAILNQTIKRGDLVLDVGANVGFHALFFSKKVGKHGQVIAFEPLKTNYDILNINAQINNLDNLTLYNALVSDSSEIVFSPAFISNESNLGATSFQTASPVEATISPLLQLTIDDLKLERCSLIKIDVEGMERKVLEGAFDTLDRQRPVIFFEQNTESNFTEIQALLGRLNYKCFWSVSKAFPKFNIRQNQVDIFRGNTETNILAVPHDAVETYEFLEHLAVVDPTTYNKPALSEMPDQYFVNSNLLSQVDLQWAHFLSSFFRA
ncbi:FkbM family methyltransferase [Kordiimonas sp.]|uniref:FkbM family methyltransferase n=1 Tax=Kordiimonas sp. TaxID=1970157 RepID=UPI003A943ABC